jgi:hypothetical protein
MQGMTYFHDCKDNKLQTAYFSNGRSSSRSFQVGSLNTNLGMRNILSLVPLASNGNTNFDVIVNSGVNSSPSALGFGSFQVLGILANTYGSVSVSSPDENQVIAEVLRVRELEDGRMDFVISTEMK